MYVKVKRVLPSHQVEILVSVRHSRWGKRTRKSFSAYSLPSHLAARTVNERVVTIACAMLEDRRRQEKLPEGPVKDKVDQLLDSVRDILGSTALLAKEWERAGAVKDEARSRLNETAAEAALAAQDEIVQKQIELFDTAQEILSQVKEMQAGCQSADWLLEAEKRLHAAVSSSAATEVVDTVPTRMFLTGLKDITQLPACKDVDAISEDIRRQLARH